MNLSCLLLLFLFCSPLLEAAALAIIEAQFPSEGYDYATSNLRGIIFDMSLGNITTMITNGIEVRLPLNIANVQPSTEMRLETETKSYSSLSQLSSSYASDSRAQWSASAEFTGILQDLAKKRGLELGRYSPTGAVGFSIGRSKEAEYKWAREQLQSVQGSVISVQASYDYVEVFLKRPWGLYLDRDFLLDFFLLPEREEWAMSSYQDKLQYKLFFDSYGTHYVDSAKFGGSYESMAFSRSCDLIMNSHTSTSLKDCIGARVRMSLSEQLRILPDVQISRESCQSFTSDGTVSGHWSFSELQTKQKWQGGSLHEAPDVMSGNFSAWVNDVVRNPRSVPTSITSIPDMIRAIHNAFALKNDVCIPCHQMKELGLSEELVRKRLASLDAAFTEYLYGGLQEKVEAENECSLTCGRCEEKPSDQCSCPNGDLDTCNLEDDSIMQAYIEKINFRVRRVGPKGAEVGWRKRIRMYVSGFGSPHDGGPYPVGTRDSRPIQSSFTRIRGESVRIEVVVESSKGLANCGLLGNCPEPFCVGSVTYGFAEVGKAKALAGPCVHGNRHENRVLQDAEVSLEGIVSFPFCCDCTTLRSNGHGLGGLSNVALGFVIVSPFLFCCCLFLVVSKLS